MKKLTKKQIEQKLVQAAREYESWCQMKFEDTLFELENETGLSEDEVRERFEQLL
jgi:hypothetical protein